MFEPIGVCKLHDDIQFTKYFWGDISEIEGKTLLIMEEANDNTSYLCMCNKGLVDVNKKDVEYSTLYGK
jgi:hypothetical protein